MGHKEERTAEGSAYENVGATYGSAGTTVS